MFKWKGCNTSSCLFISFYFIVPWICDIINGYLQRVTEMFPKSICKRVLDSLEKSVAYLRISSTDFHFVCSRFHSGFGCEIAPFSEANPRPVYLSLFFFCATFISRKNSLKIIIGNADWYWKIIKIVIECRFQAECMKWA